MLFSNLALFGTLAISAFAATPSSSDHVLHERRDNPSKAWVKRSRLDGSSRLPVRIGMTQSNLDKGHDMLMEVSQPGSPKYGQHYTAEEVTEIFAPSKTTIDAIRSWLTSAGINTARITQSVNKQWMQFDAETQELESLLNAKYHVYEHTATGAVNVACDEYHIPAHLKEHIDYITPGVKLFMPGRHKDAKSGIKERTFGITNGDNGFLPPLLKSLPLTLQTILALPTLLICAIAVTPACIKALYSVPAGKLSAAGNELGIFEGLGDVYSQLDLNLFFLTMAINIPIGTHPTLKAVDGAVAPNPASSAGPESNLDFQISYPLIYPQNSVLFQTDDAVYENNYTFSGFFNNFLDAIDGSYCTNGGITDLDPSYPNPASGGYKGQLQCGVYTPTNVISISYGGQEYDLPAAYQQRQCAEFMKLGMQGVSVVLASGDTGVAGPAGDDSANGCLNGGTVFSPDFPASCPYITTVGATYLPKSTIAKPGSEVAVTRFASGGGFSNIYPTPSYQAAAVANYFNTSLPSYKSYQLTDETTIGADGGLYNSAGRGYPDVSALGDNIIIFSGGSATLIGGTSASAPLFASLLNRINEERIAVGKSTIGFVNPTLYAHPEVLNDITVGSNPGCGTNGFSVAKGWDPVTGLGTPNYPAMLSLFMSMP